MPKTKLDFEGLIKLFTIYDQFDGPASESLWWRTDGNYSPVTMFVNCNDLFYWATADSEEIGLEDLDNLAQAVKDCDEAAKEANPGSKTLGGFYGDILWCCRQRKMRPQKPYYKNIEKYLHPLFDSCGPERI